MAGVYLVRNEDLHKIGRTDNLERRLAELKPGVLVQWHETDRSRDLEYELHQRFKSKRIPQTEYFRLNQREVDQVRVVLGWNKPPQDIVGPKRMYRNGVMKEWDPETGYWKRVSQEAD